MTSLSLLTGGEVSESAGSWECGRNGSGKGGEEEIGGGGQSERERNLYAAAASVASWLAMGNGQWLTKEKRPLLEILCPDAAMLQLLRTAG
jgi:hypothetical protein